MEKICSIKREGSHAHIIPLQRKKDNQAGVNLDLKKMCGVILTAFPKIVLPLFLLLSQLLLVLCLLIAYFTKIKYLVTSDCIIK